jgi:hypothetical protein
VSTNESKRRKRHAGKSAQSTPITLTGHEVDGKWLGRPLELGVDNISLIPDGPKEPVARVLTGVRYLHQAGKIEDRHLLASERWYADVSRANGSPLRASEARFLGVDLGGPGSAVGIADTAVEASTRHRAAVRAVGHDSAERLNAFIVDGLSLRAMALLMSPDADPATRKAKTRMTAADLTGALVADLQRLTEHYYGSDNTWAGRKPGWMKRETNHV